MAGFGQQFFSAAGQALPQGARLGLQFAQQRASNELANEKLALAKKDEFRKQKEFQDKQDNDFVAAYLEKAAEIGDDPTKMKALNDTMRESFKKHVGQQGRVEVVGEKGPEQPSGRAVDFVNSVSDYSAKDIKTLNNFQKTIQKQFVERDFKGKTKDQGRIEFLETKATIRANGNKVPTAWRQLDSFYNVSDKQIELQAEEELRKANEDLEIKNATTNFNFAKNRLSENAIVIDKFPEGKAKQERINQINKDLASLRINGAKTGMSGTEINNIIKGTKISETSIPTGAKSLEREQEEAAAKRKPSRFNKAVNLKIINAGFTPQNITDTEKGRKELAKIELEVSNQERELKNKVIAGKPLSREQQEIFSQLLHDGDIEFNVGADGSVSFKKGAGNTTTIETKTTEAIDIVDNTLGIIDDFTEQLTSSGQVGVIGALRRIVQGAGEQLNGLKDAILRDIEVTGSDFELIAMFDESLPKIDFLGNELAYALARAREPSGRLGVDDLKSARKSLRIEDMLTGKRTIEATLGSFKKVLNRTRGIAFRRKHGKNAFNLRVKQLSDRGITDKKEQAKQLKAEGFR